MLKKIIGWIAQTAKAHKRLRYPCIALLAVVYGCVTLGEYIAMPYKRYTGSFTSPCRPAVRLTAMAVAACMMFTVLPIKAFGLEGEEIADNVTVCEAHVEHDENCGFVEAIEAVACSHQNEDGSYSCALVAAEGEPTAEYLCDHSDDCGYTVAVESADCTHQCELCNIQDNDTTEPAPAVCICIEKCRAADEENGIAANINPDCRICSAENADLAAACIGEEPKPISYLMPREANVHNIKVTEFTGATVDECTYQILSETSPDTAENTTATAAAGETVTVTMSTTKDNYATQSLALNVSDTKVVRDYDNPDQFSFVMPAQAVDLTLTFGDVIGVFEKQYYEPSGIATPPSADGATPAVPYTSATPLTGDGGEFGLSYPNPIPADGGYLYKFSDGGDYGTVDTSGTHLVYTPNINAAGKEVTIYVKAYSEGGLSGAIEHKVTVVAAPCPITTRTPRSVP